jgi:hypothetical protein
METENNEEEYVPLYCDWCETDDQRDENGNDKRHEIEYDGDIQFICDECMAQRCSPCHQCGTTIDTRNWRDTFYTFQGDTWCQYCADDYLCYCDVCGEMHHNEDEPCRQHSSHLRGYSKTRAFAFHISENNIASSEPKNMLFMGTEIEAIVLDGYDFQDVVQIAHESFSPYNCELKEDSSLDEGIGGFEIVTQPMTLDYYRNVFPLRKLLKLRDAGARSADSECCGMHVHVNRGFFSNRYTSMYRFMSMFHYNNEQWKIIAGRDSVYHCSWEHGEEERMLDYVRYAHSHGMKGIASNRERYVPINLQNDDTIELRFFRGNLHPKVILARLEAIDAVARYSVSTKYSINIKKSHDWGAFRRWAEDNGYEAFSNYATNKEV